MTGSTGSYAPPRVLSVFSLVMINVIAVDSIRTLPMAASYGFALVTLYAIAALMFFIPTALITAELATTWPEKGGIYAWVKNAFGPKWGLCVVYLQWIYNVVWYPTILTLIASTIAYLIDPLLVQDASFMTTVVLTTFWGCTFLNFFGMRISSAVSTFGSLLGTLAPMAIIIGLAIAWLNRGNTPEINFSFSGLFPNVKSVAELVFFSQLVYSLLGLEMSSVHALEVKNPKKDYPKALLISAIIILISLVLASLAVAIVVPADKLNNLTGIIQAFSLFSDEFNTPWLGPLVAGAILIGGICAVATWIIGPTKGLFAAADDGLLPPFLAKTNRFGVPYPMLITQGIICSVLTLVYVLLPTVEGAYFALSVMASQLSLLMYTLLFAAAIRLRYNKADTPRTFKIPGKNWGMWLVAGSGIVISLAVVILGFFPPSSKVDVGDIVLYEAVIIGGISLILLPLVFIHKPRQQLNMSTSP
ncbi:amino acid permease [Candidatus Berkiella aquae]|uniref:APC family permease n=1 Tax=Candidatus Berkiella aquae TaxID=295108 RepID=A0A0Q9Z1B0_9GAMM|nr:amino acid permease [Candidatus Berkiella aquae]MCS5712471.1 APC family permease [Candidatus Berkiella aquae]